MKPFLRKAAKDLSYIGLIVIIIMTASGVVTGCSSPFKSYVNDYQQALLTQDESLSSELSPEQYKREKEKNFARFKAMFADLKHADIEATVAAVYADELYFNDTFRSVYTAADLSEYLQETIQSLGASRIEYTELAFNEASYFLSWVMYIEFEAAGRPVQAESIGITQLRFDHQGKIVFHQDFWDNTQGFFGHLPYLGYFINKVRERLH